MIMDLTSIDIAAYSTEKALTDTKDSAGVKLLNNQRNQQTAVVGSLISSIKETPRTAEQTGHGLNLKA